jgi:hypothetical protein
VTVEFEIQAVGSAQDASFEPPTNGNFQDVIAVNCLTVGVTCESPSDCCSGRCALGQCRHSTAGNRSREKARLGMLVAGGAASRSVNGK